MKLAPHLHRIGNDIVQAASASVDGEVLRDVRVYQRDAQETLHRRIHAEAVTAQPNGSWALQNAVVTEVEGDRASSISERVPQRRLQVWNEVRAAEGGGDRTDQGDAHLNGGEEAAGLGGQLERFPGAFVAAFGHRLEAVAAG